MTNSKKAFAYIRTSNKTPLEASEALSIQRQHIEKYAEANDITVVKWFEDSGDIGRADFGKLIEAAENGNIDNVNYVLVNSLTRISRDFTELNEIQGRLDARGVTLKTVGEEFNNTEMGRFMERLIKLIGELDRDSKSGAVKQAIIRSCKQGYYPNIPLFGYAKTSESGLHSPTQDGRYLGKYLRQTVNGNIGTEELRLKVSELLGRTEPISIRRLKGIALRPYYAGVVLYNGISYDGKHEALITKEEHEKLKAMFA